MADFTRGDVAHLLRRAGFSSTPAEIDAVASETTWADVVDRVLDTTANPPDPLPTTVTDPNVKKAEAVVAAIGWWLGRMATTPTPTVEKVTFFWHGILTSSAAEVGAVASLRQIQTWRRLGLGDIEVLMQAMALDPAMLEYLDNGYNVKRAPNENFARELMELFTMGNFTYTEADVVAMARAWTGHNLQVATDTYVFRPFQHDDGDKTLFGITRNWDGPDTITEILRGSKQPVSARYLAGRIWGAFADPNPPTGLLDELTASLVAVDLDMAAFLRTVFLRPEFRSATTRQALVRSPVEWEVAIMRATGLGPADLPLVGLQQRLGQVPLIPPNVSGWRQNAAWISSSAAWAKGLVAAGLQAKLTSTGAFADLDGLAVSDAVAAALSRMGVDAPATATVGHLQDFLAGERAAGRGVPACATLAALVTLTPDFQLA